MNCVTRGSLNKLAVAAFSSVDNGTFSKESSFGLFEKR